MYGKSNEKEAVKSNWLNLTLVNPAGNERVQELVTELMDLLAPEMANAESTTALRMKRGIQLTDRDPLHEAIVNGEEAARKIGKSIPTIMIGKTYIAEIDAKQAPKSLDLSAMAR